NTGQGFGLRSVLGEATGYAHASELSEDAIRRAATTVRAVQGGHSGKINLSAFPLGTNRSLYSDVNPLHEVPFEAKLSVLQEIDAYVRAQDSRVRQVSVSLAGEWQAVEILRADGRKIGDIRPLVRLNVNVVLEENGRMESGSSGAGGRVPYAEYLTPEQ